MLRRLRIDNFKSLINIEVQPSAVNLLIGRNNSGKTNLCQALCFLSTSVQTPLDHAAATVADPWTLTNTYLKRDLMTFEVECDLDGPDGVLTFDYTLVLRASAAPHAGPLGRELVVSDERLSVSGGIFGSGARLLENQSGAVRLLHEGRHAAGMEDAFVETTAPTNGTMLQRLYDRQHNGAANGFKDYLASWRYYDFEPCRLRDAQSTVPAVLMPDGANMSLLLYQLKTMRERDYRRLLDLVREIEPKLDALNFVPPSQESVFMFMADQQNNIFTPRALSNGTLRYLALAYVLLFEASEPRIVLIEEPENGLHVGHLKRLLSLVPSGDQAGGQVIFTSHSPYFIDLFDEHLDGLLLARSAGTHSEIVKPAPERIRAVLEEFDLGEAHFRGLLQ